MMLQKKINLEKLNTLGVSAVAEHYFCLESLDQLESLSQLVSPVFYLGGGSNVLFTQNYLGTVLHNCLKGIEVIEEDDLSVLVRASAGENWHAFVTFAINSGWYGLECLAYIPGTVGATPVQNIGAYGIEVREYIEKVHVYNVALNQHEAYENQECCFGYRDSAFKSHLQGRLVLSVDFRLPKTPKKYERFYPALQEHLLSCQITQPSAEDVYRAVIAVRQSKLPEVGEIGSAGSFFKNPIVSKEHFNELMIRFPNLTHYQYDKDNVKLPAGQLIDLLGFKGAYNNNVGMYEKQALILVNLGGATGEMLYQHSQKVMAAVYDEFKIHLEPEVIIL